MELNYVPIFGPKFKNANGIEDANQKPLDLNSVFDCKLPPVDNRQTKAPFQMFLVSIYGLIGAFSIATNPITQTRLCNIQQYFKVVKCSFSDDFF